jgi:polysaccharide export outer membrane protein
MTITPKSILTTLALAGLALLPPQAQAQSRSGPAAQVPAARRAPAPDPAPATPPPAAARPAAAATWTDQEYRVGPGDKLRVEVYGEPQLSQSLQVRPDGRITMPLIGDLPAVAQTPAQLRDAIGTSLKEYITNPVVTVIVQEAVAAQVYVIGEVSRPGVQVMQ